MKKSITFLSALFLLFSIGKSQVRFVKVNPATDAIYIKNFGDSQVNLATYRLCSEFKYTGNLTFDVTLLSGSTNLAAGDTLSVSWPIADAAADLGLYGAEGSFGDTSAMVDFLQWGEAGIGRESVANSKGIWTAGEFIEGDGPYIYTGDGNGSGQNVWENEAEEPAANLVKIVRVNPTTDAIYIKNFGDSEIDISDYRLCSEFAYTTNLTLDVTPIKGNTNLGAGDTLAVSWPITDEAADLGLYLAEGSFGDTSVLVDFLQWGGAGIGREVVANSKGIWTAGEFIQGDAPFSYTGDGTESGLAFWETMEKEPAAALVGFLKVNPATDDIYIKNFGEEEIDISAYRLCSEFGYTSDLDLDITLVSGSTTLGAGDTLVVNWPITDEAADLGLYLAEGSFGDTSILVDFLQWGAPGIGREGVAASKGIWTAGEFIEGDAPFCYTGDGTESGLNFWQAGEEEPSAALVGFLQVNPSTDAIYIKNFGEEAIDISAYRLCSEFTYTTNLTSDVSLISGSTSLEAGDTLVVSWPITDAAADLGLYLAAGAFSDTSAMVDFLQWGAAGIGREVVAASKGIWTAGEFIEGDGPFRYTGNGAESGLSFWEANEIEEPAAALVGFLQVNPSTDAIYIKNFGGEAIDISAYRLCSEFTYTSNLTSDISLVSGSTTLGAGDTLVVTWPITDAAADLGLYLASGGFGDTSAMVDFLQWGAAGIGREGVAASKGIWTAGEFIEGDAPFKYTGNGAESGLAFWEANEVEEPAPALVGFLQVNPSTDAIYIKNFGGEAIDISAYRLCSEFTYTSNLTSDVSLVSGSTTLGAGDTLVVTWPITDAAADLGLYLAAGGFGDTSAMVDFLQWGAAGIGRESVAASKGIWTAGDFIIGEGPYFYTGNGAESGLTFWADEPVLTDIDPAIRRLIDVSVFPSPAIDQAQLRIQLPVSGTIQVALLDGMGRRLSQDSFQAIPGVQERNLNLSSLSSGLYYVQVLLDGDLITVSHVIKR